MRSTLLTLLLLALTSVLAPTAQASLGRTTTGNFTDQPGDGTTGSGQDWRAVAGSSEPVDRLNVYLGATTGHPEVGLYSSSRTRLGSCTIDSPQANAWNRCVIPTVNLTGGATYWLALLRPQGQGVVRFSNESGAGQSYGSRSSSLVALPATWTNGSNYGAQSASLYADAAPTADTTPPTATLTGPADGATVSGSVNVTADVTDVGGSGVWFAAFRVDGQDPTGDQIDYTSPYGFTLDTTQLPDGDHTLSVRAEDNAQNIGEDSTVTVHVDNTTPAACADGQDNDGDGLTDFPADPGCSSAQDGDETDPSGEPAPIAGQGYHQAFRDDFDTLDRQVWDDHIWYDDAPNPAWTGFQEVSDGILHLRTSRSFFWGPGPNDNYPINTVTTHSSGRTFQYGYFEARMNWPSGAGSWPAFWLISDAWATNGSCANSSGEIDTMEGQGTEPNVLYGTVHQDSAGRCEGHQQNGNNWQPQSFRLADTWHTYGVKWTPTTVTWYLDGVQTHSAPTYPDDNQPMMLLLQEWVGGWTSGVNSTTPDVLDNQVDYVQVWQQ